VTTSSCSRDEPSPVRNRPPPATNRRRPALLLLAAALTLSVVLGACGGVVGSVLSTRQALDDAGFSHVSVSLGGETNVKVSATVDQNASAAEVREIAAIVWRDFHERFDFVDITLHAADRTERGSLPFSPLQQEFGARPAADNRTTIRSGIVHVGLEVLGGSAVVVLVIIVLIVALVRRRRRRPRLRPGPWTAPGPPDAALPGATPPNAIWPPAPGGSPGSGPTPGADAPWGAPVPAPSGSDDPWQPPPGSGPPGW
jgi:hypothetical protein